MKITSFLISSLLILLTTGCGDSKSNTGTANTVLDQCVANGTCTNVVYNSYSQYGWSAYPNYVNGYAQFYAGSPYYNYCACPNGTRPVYNQYFGLGCYSQSNFQPFAAYASYYGYATYNTHWVNIPRISNLEGYPDNGCFSNVAESCYVRSGTNTCSSGKTCLPTAAGSPLGICINP